MSFWIGVLVGWAVATPLTIITLAIVGINSRKAKHVSMLRHPSGYAFREDLSEEEIEAFVRRMNGNDE